MIRYLTAVEISMLYGRQVNTIHRLAHEDVWRRSGDGRRPVLYLAEDVEKTMKRLAERRNLTG